MIQDIEPRKFDITYRGMDADFKDRLLVYVTGPDGTEYTLVKEKDGDYDFLQFEDADLEHSEATRSIWNKIGENLWEDAKYGFSIDGEKYYLHGVEGFLSQEEMEALSGNQGSGNQEGWELTFITQKGVREISSKWMGFALITGWQITRWYGENQYCGACGHRLQPREIERALSCPDCGRVVYPKISPAVIVGVVDGEKLLLTKYAPGEHNYRRYALIAGFCEVGETLEDTVRREVMEEVGLKVKDIVYFKNQPWSFSDSLLVGFFAKLDGDNRVRLQDGELSEGTWFAREDIQVNPDTAALTTEMIRFFAEGGNPWRR